MKTERFPEFHRAKRVYSSVFAANLHSRSQREDDLKGNSPVGETHLCLVKQQNNAGPQRTSKHVQTGA